MIASWPKANEQLTRELLQSQASTLAACLASRRVVSLGISPSYVKDWMAADAFRELYQNWYVPVSWTGADLCRKEAIVKRLDLDRELPAIL
jgi:hypothetical protein